MPTTPRYPNPPSAIRFGYELTKLGMDSAVVVALRSLRLAKGGEGASRELSLMFAEKAEAFAEAQELMLTRGAGLSTGRLANEVIEIYARRVRANISRLR